MSTKMKLDFHDHSLFKIALGIVTKANLTNPVFYIVFLFTSIMISYFCTDIYVYIAYVYTAKGIDSWLVYLIIMIAQACILLISYNIYTTGTIEGILRRLSNDEVYVYMGNSYQDTVDNCLQVLYRAKFHRYALITPSITRETAHAMALIFREYK